MHCSKPRQTPLAPEYWARSITAAMAGHPGIPTWLAKKTSTIILARHQAATRAIRHKNATAFRQRAVNIAGRSSKNVSLTPRSRSEERRVGKEGVGTCRTRCSQLHKKKKKKN